MVLDPPAAPAGTDVAARYVRPLAVREIRGLAWRGEDLLVLDTRTGRLALVDPRTDATRVVDDGLCEQLRGARGLAVADGAVWFTTDAGLHRTPWLPAPPEPGVPRVGPPELVRADSGLSAVGVVEDAVYLVRDSELLELDPVDVAGPPRRCVPLPGIGRKGLAATAGALWLSDDLEQSVWCLDRASLAVRFRVVTPLEGPTALMAQQVPGAPDVLHVAYHEDEPFLRDNPWIDPGWEVGYRDRALVHQLRVHHDPAAGLAWSTGHRIQMHYYVEIDPDRDALTGDCAELADVTWRMGLPIDSPRQRVLDVAPIALPFQVEDDPDLEGRSQPVAVFRIPRVSAGTRLVLGWRATLELFGVVHLVSAEDLADAPDLDPQRAAHYLVDDEDLDLGAAPIVAATDAAVGDEANVWRRAHRIRSYVYDRLSYAMGNADSPVGVLARGTGSCGEHVGTMLALMRTAGLACRVAGRYKCPYQPWSGAPLHPDFNHVWVDLYLPGYGWAPVESNPDGDVVDTGPYPDRFFLALPWRHVEFGKDVSFEKVTYDAGPAEGDPTRPRRRRIGARSLSRNHIRFDVLAEIAPIPG